MLNELVLKGSKGVAAGTTSRPRRAQEQSDMICSYERREGFEINFVLLN